MMDAARAMTAGAIDLGEKPSVISGDRQVPHHRARPPASSTTRWTSTAARASASGPTTSSAAPTSRCPVVDHRRGREHPDAQPDHLRPGRDPLPSLRAEGDAGDARDATAPRPRATSTGALRPRRASRVANAVRAFVHGPHRLALGARARERRARDAALLPAAHAVLGGVRVPRRRVDAGAGRRAEAPREALGAARRHPVAAVPRVGDAQALRGRGPPARRPAAPRLGDLGRDVPRAERVRGRDLELSRAASPAWLLRRIHLPARAALRRAVRPARPRRGEAR